MSNGRMRRGKVSDRYQVEWDEAGCYTCGNGRTWGIVLPGEEPPFLGISFESKTEAEEWCDFLNQAYELGKKAGARNETV